MDALIVIVGVAVGIAALVFWVWMLVDCLKYESSEGNDKLVWVVAIVVTKLFGAILYYFMRRRARQRLAAG